MISRSGHLFIYFKSISRRVRILKRFFDSTEESTEELEAILPIYLCSVSRGNRIGIKVEIVVCFNFEGLSILCRDLREELCRQERSLSKKVENRALRDL